MFLDAAQRPWGLGRSHCRRPVHVKVHAMTLPLEMCFHGMEPSEAVAMRVREKATESEPFFGSVAQGTADAGGNGARAKRFTLQG